MMNKKNIAVSGYYGFENFGDEAILKVIVSELKARDYGVTVFSKNPENTKNKLEVNSVYTFSLSGIFKTLKNSDVLISGGGSLLQDVTSLKSLFYYLFVIGIALFLKNEVIIFAQGIGPINNPIGRLLTKMLLKNCKYITVRDEKSLFRLRGWNLKPELVSDPVWSLPVGNWMPECRIGVQLRSWKNLSRSYLSKLAKSVVSNFSDKDIYIYSFQDALDLEICRNFEAELKLLKPDINTQILNGLSIDETIESFSHLDFLIGMRYHACLLALKYGIPTLALSYDEKVEKIAKRFDLPCSFLLDEENLEALFVSLKELNPDKIKENARKCLFNFDNIVEKIES